MTKIVFRAVAGSGPNKETLDYIAKDDPGCGKKFDPGLCKIRHIAAKLREERGMRTEYEPCAYCPYFTAQPPEQEQKLCTSCGTRPQMYGYDLCRRCQNNPKWVQEEKMTANKKTETCSDCGAPITPLRKRKSGLCKLCYSKEYKRKARLAKGAQCPATAKVTQDKSDDPLEPFKELLARHRADEKKLAEDAEEAMIKFDALVDKKRIAKGYADVLEQAIKKAEEKKP